VRNRIVGDRGRNSNFQQPELFFGAWADRGAEARMTSVQANRTLLHPADAKLLRVALIYVLPGLAVFYVVVSGLWLLPDSFLGMYGNHDGHWASWNARGILEWGEFLDFSPVSPLTGTGSPFLPNLPWLNPGSLPLALPAPLPLQHLASMLVYLAELSGSLYLLYRHLEFSREHSYLATILYICIFFIPLSGITLALPWYSLAPFNAHLIAAMNVASIALIRVGYERLAFKLLYGVVFAVALFVAFASAPITSMTYVPVYAVLWLAFLIPLQAHRRAVLWRWGAIAFALLVLGLIGVPFYLAAMAMTSARGDYAPPIFHPGWKLLSPTYWQELIWNLPVCSNLMQLMCPSAFISCLRRHRRKKAIWLRDHCAARIASLLCSVEHATSSWSAPRRQHALPHVGVLSARYACGNRLRHIRYGLADAWPCREIGLDAGSGKLPHRGRRSICVGPSHTPVSTARPRSWAARTCSNRAHSREQRADTGLPPAAHWPEAWYRVPGLRDHVPRRAGRFGPQSDPDSE
jgi:hypothetical protein